MIKKYSLIFHENAIPVRELVTKFGGQPVWISPPQWPLSRMTQVPMQFIGQIRLYPELFGEIEAQMAYLFMSYDHPVQETWDPEEGESAVILQPGVWDGPSEPRVEGPYTGVSASISEELWWHGPYPPPPARKEYTVDLIAGEDPEIYIVEDNILENEEKWDHYWNDLRESKIGGIPTPNASNPVYPPFPSHEEWPLLLQISQPNVPFEVNFGTDGIGTVFLSKDGKQAFLRWRRS